MKFFIVLACLALAHADYQRSSYSSYSSGGSRGGLSLGGLGGLSGLVGGGVLQARQVDSSALAGFQAQQQVPVTLLVAQPVQATAAIGTYGGNYGAASQSASYGASSAVAGGRAHSGGVIEAAVISQRNVQVVDAPSTPVDSTPAQVVIPPTVQGVHLEFQSQSSPVTVTANHIPGQAAAPQESSHEEEADIVRQNIVKPVIHEVHEIITPYRRVSQEVKPVQEEINQVVTTGHREVQQQQAVQRSAGYSAGAQRAQVGGGATILALVTDGNAAGLLSGARSSGASFGASRGVSVGSLGVSQGLGAGYGASQGLAGGFRAGAVQGLGGGFGGSVQRTSSYSSRSSSSSY